MTTRKHHHLPKAVEKKTLKQFDKSKKKNNNILFAIRPHIIIHL